MIQWLGVEEIPITEGPTVFERRTFLFIRDPDGNVLEFMQTADAEEGHAPV